MSKRSIIGLKVLLHVIFLAPFAYVVQRFHSGALALDADPVNWITHFTGNWALWILLADLSITPLRRISTPLSFLVRFRRMIGLYAFFYATLHLATYVFLFSGFDLLGALTAARHGHAGEFVTQTKQVWPVILDDLRKRRFVQVGLASWFTLFLLAITSPTAVLRALGGKNWQRFHRLIYFAAIAAVIHYWWLVKTGVRAPWKDTAVLALLLAARLAYAALKRRYTGRPVTPVSRPLPGV